MKIRTTLLVCGTFLVGVIAGGSTVIWAFTTFLLEPQIVSSASLGVTGKVAVLEAINSGDQKKAKSLLETFLDGDLITLSVFPEKRLDSSAAASLFRASEYRAKFPYSSVEPTVSTQVSTLLSKYKNRAIDQPAKGSPSEGAR